MDQSSCIKQIKQAFQYGDSKNTGTLNANEYRIAIMTLFGYEPHEWEIDQLFPENNTSTSYRRRINFDEFKSIVQHKLSYYDPEHYIREIFAAFDTDWKGYITADDVKRAWNIALPKLSWNSLKEAFNECCFNDKGIIDFLQFRQFMMDNSFDF